MGEFITVQATDGHRLRAWRALPPAGTATRGGLIVGQELFGVNTHIRYVCERYAAQGFAAIAPCFYDRVRPGGFEAGYTQDDLEAARIELLKLDIAAMMLDTAAALDAVRAHGKTGMVGYCSGGSTAWYAACTLPGLACAISYYGGRIVQYADMQPKCPVMLHWGATDHTIALDAVRGVEARHKDIRSFIYEGAGHGFNCDLRAAFNPDAFAQSWKRTLDFLHYHVG
jgi:carboxymethylenebutenolidase